MMYTFLLSHLHHFDLFHYLSPYVFYIFSHFSQFFYSQVGRHLKISDGRYDSYMIIYNQSPMPIQTNTAWRKALFVPERKISLGRSFQLLQVNIL